MAKKFFYNRVYNTRRTIISIIIIGICIIGIIVCFIVTSNFQGESKKNSNDILNIKNEVTVEVNEKFTNEIFFSKIDGDINLDEIKVTYPDDYDNSKAGNYEVILNISGKNYSTILNVVDTTKPELVVQEITINEGENYTADNFVKNCSDNSNKDCIISFYSQGIDEEGNSVDYSKYTKAGNYVIKISAKDDSNNETVEETKLTINKKGDTSSSSIIETPTTNTTCKYGNGNYDTENYVLTVNITSNNCAVSLDLYKDTTMAKDINQLMDTETTKIKKDVEALKLTGTYALNRKVTAIVNNTGDGIVGYELQITVTITNNNKSTIIAEYKVNKDGKRIFTKNLYNLAN